MKTYRAKVTELQPGTITTPAVSDEWDFSAMDKQDAVLIGKGAKPTHAAISVWIDILQKALGKDFSGLAHSLRQEKQQPDLQSRYILAAAQSGDVFYSPFPYIATNFADQVIHATQRYAVVPPIRIFVFDWPTLTPKAAFQGWIDANETWQKL